MKEVQDKYNKWLEERTDTTLASFHTAFHTLSYKERQQFRENNK